MVIFLQSEIAKCEARLRDFFQKQSYVNDTNMFITHRSGKILYILSHIIIKFVTSQHLKCHCFLILTL